MLRCDRKSSPVLESDERCSYSQCACLLKLLCQAVENAEVYIVRDAELLLRLWLPLFLQFEKIPKGSTAC